MPSATAQSAPVIVVGGGPAGVTTAAALARHRVPVLLVEAEPVPKTDWRASTFHPSTLELLSELGVAEQMHAEGLAVPLYQYRDRQDGLIAQFDFRLLADETRYPHRLQINQQHLVRMMMERLAADPCVTLRFGTRATAVQSTSAGVSVQVSTPTGSETLHGSFVIGADGAASTVRELLGVDFDGFTYPERFLIASTSVDMRSLLPDIADVNYIADPQEWLFLLHTPESWRAVYPVPTTQSREQACDLDQVQSHLQGIAPYPSGYPVIDCQIYNVHQRVASSFRAGRAVLIGDAAHINSPIGGVGLNSGIHDGIDIARRIARIQDEGADVDAELDTFALLRRRVALEYVQADTKRNTERLSERDEAKRRAHHDELRAVAADEERARAWCRRTSLLESVRRFGIGLRPDEVSEHADNSSSAASSDAMYAGTSATTTNGGSP